MSVFYIDGEFVDSKDAVLSVSDMAVLRGYGIFDFFLRTYNGRPFYLKEHVQRFANSGAHVGLDLPCSQEEVCDIVMDTLSRNDFEESNIRFVYTGRHKPRLRYSPGKRQAHGHGHRKNGPPRLVV